MNNPNAIEDEIDAIRLAIYEETKDMTPEQRAERTRRIGDEIIQKYGLEELVVHAA